MVIPPILKLSAKMLRAARRTARIIFAGNSSPCLRSTTLSLSKGPQRRRAGGRGGWVGQIGEPGQALILIVFAIVGLVAATGLVVDGGNVYLVRRQAQNAADAAALGGSLARIHNEDWVNSTLAIAAENGFTNDGQTISILVASPPPDGPYEGNTQYLMVQINTYTPTYLASVIGIRTINSSVQAIAFTRLSEIREILDGNALISLAPESDCEAHRSFVVEGEASLDIWDAGIFINSNNPDCALIEKGSGSILLESEGKEITVVGGADIQKPERVSPYPPRTGAAPISYPPPFFMPKVGCSGEAEINEDGFSMSPGAWGDEDFPPPGVTSLDAGIYCLGGDFKINGGLLEGNNLVISVPDGQVHWSGSAQIDLKGRAAGPLAGLLLYLPPDNHKRIVLNGGPQSSIKGTILAPGSEIHINGMASDTGFHSQIIGYRIEVNGQSNIVIKYVDEQNYDAVTMPEIQLVK